ncbi:MAG TPA: nickel pincer cofactor biosynthesis protein LarC, partial [Bacteroidales bacterium]|nr:nickel pincer cofactor biosynthesis protein LarC [Bacteroidales bacterium]
KLQLQGWEMLIEKDQRHGITGTKVTVKQTHHEHAHRHLSDIEKIINDSKLNNRVRELSKKIFMKVAEAEASVHGVSVNKVHFHEVGAIDSIVDTVGAAICFNNLDVDAVFVGPVELGGGFINCSHGRLPVPAPATAEIIKGLEVTRGGAGFEATTPTGAAILASLGTHFNNLPSFRINKTGYGVGQKDDPEIPNVLRVFLGESEGTISGHDALLIQCNIDDMNPEFYDHISEKLFKSGAADVFISNIIMKKGRPGNVLNIICEKGNEDILKEIIFTESTSVGVRTFPFRKDTLIRKIEQTDTTYGKVTVKRSFYNGREVSCKPEYSECKRIAEERGIPVKEVYNNIMASIVKI